MYDIYSVNGIFSLSSGPQGGRHVDYVADQVVTKLVDVVKKKNKAGVTVKPFQVFCFYCNLVHGLHKYYDIYSLSVKYPKYSEKNTPESSFLFFPISSPGEEPHVAVCKLPDRKSHLRLSDEREHDPAAEELRINLSSQRKVH